MSELGWPGKYHYFYVFYRLFSIYRHHFFLLFCQWTIWLCYFYLDKFLVVSVRVVVVVVVVEGEGARGGERLECVWKLGGRVLVVCGASTNTHLNQALSFMLPT